MTQRLIPILTLLLPLAALAGEEEAAPPERGAERFFNRLDKDSDGKLAAAEWPERMRLPFAEADRNGDGFVDPKEFGGAMQRRERDRRADPKQLEQMAQRFLERLDTDGDGKLSAGELPERRGRMDLSQADRNGDGFVDAAELGRALGRMRGGDRGADRLRTLKRMDANGDGRIERAEWKGNDEMFARLDANGDGALGADELRRAGEGMRDRGRAGAALFRRADKDGDGRVSREEWPLDARFFDRFDSNGDGFIGADEVMVRDRRRRGGRHDANTGKDSAHFLRKYDRNGDDSVTKEEFPHARRFAEIDADGDGKLSRAEIEEATDRKLRESDFGFFDRFDLDRDGKVTREEFTGPARVFERRDRNHDGVIDATDRPDEKQPK